MELSLKYGERTESMSIDDQDLLGIISPIRPLAPAPNPTDTIYQALKSPIGTPPFVELLHNQQTVTIVVDDHTRSTPTHEILPPLLHELETHGIKQENINILFATGTHRAVNPEEAKRLLGKALATEYAWDNHDCLDEDNLQDLGSTSYQTPIYLNKQYLNSDLRIVTGDICFHYYAGYGGGRKSILPGVAGNTTIRTNHRMFLDPNARTGILKANPIHLDMMEVAHKAPPHFMVNVALTTDDQISCAWAGDVITAWEQGVKVYNNAFTVPISQPADIVVVSAGGFPKDIDFYQAYKAMDNAASAVRKGGVMILLAECREDAGNPIFEEWMKKYPTLTEATKEIHTNFALGGHKAYLLLKMLDHCYIILVSDIPPDTGAMTFQLEPAGTLSEALHQAYKRVGPRPTIWVMPDGYITLPILTQS